jgi:hypothetical protein
MFMLKISFLKKFRKRSSNIRYQKNAEQSNNASNLGSTGIWYIRLQNKLRFPDKFLMQKRYRRKKSINKIKPM